MPKKSAKNGTTKAATAKTATARKKIPAPAERAGGPTTTPVETTALETTTSPVERDSPEAAAAVPAGPKAKRADKAAAEPKVKKSSALDAAAQVLEDAGRPMACKELIEAMTARGLWTSPNGATPEATLYSAVLRELKAKGDAARFVKAGRGLFAFRTQA